MNERYWEIILIWLKIYSLNKLLLVCCLSIWLRAAASTESVPVHVLFVPFWSHVNIPVYFLFLRFFLFIQDYCDSWVSVNVTFYFHKKQVSITESARKMRWASCSEPKCNLSVTMNRQKIVWHGEDRKGYWELVRGPGTTVNSHGTPGSNI